MKKSRCWLSPMERASHAPVSAGSQGHRRGQGPQYRRYGRLCTGPHLYPDLARQVEQNIPPLLRGFSDLGIDYRGVIYAGLMV